MTPSYSINVHNWPKYVQLRNGFLMLLLPTSMLHQNEHVLSPLRQTRRISSNLSQPEFQPMTVPFLTMHDSSDIHDIQQVPAVQLKTTYATHFHKHVLAVYQLYQIEHCVLSYEQRKPKSSKIYSRCSLKQPLRCILPRFVISPSESKSMLFLSTVSSSFNVAHS